MLEPRAWSPRAGQLKGASAPAPRDVYVWAARYHTCEPEVVVGAEFRSPSRIGWAGHGRRLPVLGVQQPVAGLRFSPLVARDLFAALGPLWAGPVGAGRLLPARLPVLLDVAGSIPAVNNGRRCGVDV